jgi:hypothetical protein
MSGAKKLCSGLGWFVFTYYFVISYMTGLVRPNHVIVIRGSPINLEYVASDDSAIKPGDLVYLSDENTVNQGGAKDAFTGVALGIAGYEQAHSLCRPKERSEAYKPGTMIPVILNGSGVLVMANCTSAVTEGGMALTSNGDGALKPAEEGDIIYAVSLEKYLSGLTPIRLN